MKKLLSKDMINTLHTRCSGSTTSRYIRLSNGSLNWGWHLSISLNKRVITICFQFVSLPKVRMTAHSARSQHLMASGLMKKFTVTAFHIIDTMIPMILDAVELQVSLYKQHL